MRYFIELSYNGTAYHGWQIQKNAHSVQQALNTALRTILGQSIETVGSGRTDAGVHALQQVCHVDLNHDVDTDELIYKLNSLLPNDISVKTMYRVADEAHARYDATSRSYQYQICRRKNPFKTDTCYYFNRELSLDKMNGASQMLLGEQDFKSFSKTKTSVEHFVCTITEAVWHSDNDSYCFYVSANRFLRGMVRALVGTLLEVGTGKLDSNQFKQVIASKDRRKAGRAVPAHGLFLTKVVYPDKVTSSY